jgi:hypothetical protein
MARDYTRKPTILARIQQRLRGSMAEENGELGE